MQDLTIAYVMKGSLEMEYFAIISMSAYLIHVTIMPTALITMEVTRVCAAMGSQEMEPTAKTSTNVYPTHAMITLIALILQEVTFVSVNQVLLVMALNVTI